MAVDPTDEHIRDLHTLLEDYDNNPRFVSRRAIDKSCYEVIEVTDPDCVPAAGYPVVDRCGGPTDAQLLARVRSRSWVIKKMIDTLNGKGL